MIMFFYIREEEMIDILDNVDFSEFTAVSHLLIVSANDDLAVTTSKTEEAIQKLVKQ